MLNGIATYKPCQALSAFSSALQVPDHQGSARWSQASSVHRRLLGHAFDDNVPGDRGLAIRAFPRDFPDDITLVVHPLADGFPRPGWSINYFKYTSSFWWPRPAAAAFLLEEPRPPVLYFSLCST